MSGVFVGGTDTGCGKTTVAAALARTLRERGLRVRVLKPVETGCRIEAGERIPEDALTLARAAGDARPSAELCPYPLLLPAAPAVAAASEGVELELARIAAAHARAARDADHVIVEGAGGLRVPLTAELDMLDLCLRLRLPLLLVARARLGTINHTLLSISEAMRRGVRVCGVVINHAEGSLSAPDRENLGWLLRHCPAPVLGELPYARSGGSASASAIDWDRIWTT